MDCVSTPKTVSRKDAGFEPPWMGLRRVFSVDTQSMSLDIICGTAVAQTANFSIANLLNIYIDYSPQLPCSNETSTSCKALH
jgi:hypothetical protein